MIEGKVIFLMLLCMVLCTACQKNDLESMSSPQQLSGKKIGHGAEQSVVSATNQRDHQLINPYAAPSKAAQRFIGRYQVTISCQDPYAGCIDGVVEATVLLAKDGVAHRTVVNIGTQQVTHDVRQRRDFWTYDEKQQQIIIQNTEGAEIFFNIEGRDLKMDLHRIAYGTARNREYFGEYGRKLPQQAYVLQRVL